ncbi:hypothetical protein [Microbacterium deminutum]|uniref:SDR family NAD(P)-dependent oxidoreductase n=1 Tax=Microbacterium deminutum TaxID=344164 RepID=A0ABN2R2Y7_9MICO
MILDSLRLDRKVALVTGARRGLGEAAAAALAEPAPCANWATSSPRNRRTRNQYIHQNGVRRRQAVLSSMRGERARLGS